jgi:hypothetical protein
MAAKHAEDAFALEERQTAALAAATTLLDEGLQELGKSQKMSEASLRSDLEAGDAKLRSEIKAAADRRGACLPNPAISKHLLLAGRRKKRQPRPRNARRQRTRRWQKMRFLPAVAITIEPHSLTHSLAHSLFRNAIDQMRWTNSNFSIKELQQQASKSTKTTDQHNLALERDRKGSDPRTLVPSLMQTSSLYP